jgi:hypothetical protein
VVLSSTSGTSAAGPLGLAVHATWRKPGAGDLTNFTDSQGGPLAFAPGRTWIILAPPGTEVATSRGRP